MKTIIVLFVLLFIVVFISAGYIGKKNISLLPHASTVTIDAATFQVEVENTDAAREKGLSARSSLATGHGMLFLFDTPNRYGFWMKDMKFPIDIIFINKNTIINTYTNIPAPIPNTPDTSLPVYFPTSPIYKALEVPAGTIHADHIKNGDTVHFSL